jgi:hypothetical protein
MGILGAADRRIAWGRDRRRPTAGSAGTQGGCASPGRTRDRWDRTSREDGSDPRWWRMIPGDQWGRST